MGNERRRRAGQSERVSTESDSLSPDTVTARLAALRVLYQPERDVDARARLARERAVIARIPRPLAVSVAERLRELRALCELAAHLHRARKPSKR